MFDGVAGDVIRLWRELVSTELSVSDPTVCEVLEGLESRDN
jgi:hypothetical protein